MQGRDRTVVLDNGKASFVGRLSFWEQPSAGGYEVQTDLEEVHFEQPRRPKIQHKHTLLGDQICLSK
jgi:hypothetical protein